MTRDEFNKLYYDSKPPEIRAVLNMPTNMPEDQKARAEKARDLAEQGFIVDAHIEAWGMDPYLTMRLRHEYGYTWVPSALQPPVAIAPGLFQPGTLPYDPDHPPHGSIKVSLDPADYPPFDPPQTVPPNGYQPPYPATYEQLPGVFVTPGGDNWPVGSEITRIDGKTLVKVKQGSGWRTAEYWRFK